MAPLEDRFLAPVLLYVRLLVRLREPVRCFGVHDLPQLRLAFGAHGLECGIEPEVVALVRIGPEIGGGGSSTGSTSAAEPTKCPFPAMIPAMEGARPGQALRPGSGQAGEPIPVRWTSGAEARLANIPAFVRPMARTGIERFARERGSLEVDETILDAARDFFGM